MESNPRPRSSGSTSKTSVGPMEYHTHRYLQQSLPPDKKAMQSPQALVHPFCRSSGLYGGAVAMPLPQECSCGRGLMADGYRCGYHADVCGNTPRSYRFQAPGRPRHFPPPVRAARTDRQENELQAHAGLPRASNERPEPCTRLESDAGQPPPSARTTEGDELDNAAV